MICPNTPRDAIATPLPYARALQPNAATPAPGIETITMVAGAERIGGEITID
jgi:hypothetical protein